MEQVKLINPRNISEEEVKKYKIREAARAVVFDGNGLVALLYATKTFYYKLPGEELKKAKQINRS